MIVDGVVTDLYRSGGRVRDQLLDEGANFGGRRSECIGGVVFCCPLRESVDRFLVGRAHVLEHLVSVFLRIRCTVENHTVDPVREHLSIGCTEVCTVRPPEVRRLLLVEGATNHVEVAGDVLSIDVRQIVRVLVPACVSGLACERNTLVPSLVRGARRPHPCHLFDAAVDRCALAESSGIHADDVVCRCDFRCHSRIQNLGQSQSSATRPTRVGEQDPASLCGVGGCDPRDRHFDRFCRQGRNSPKVL